MNRSDIKSTLQYEFENSANFEEGDYDVAIQDAYEELALFSGCLSGSVVLNYQTNLTYYDLPALIPDFFALTSIFNNLTKRWMCPTSRRKLEGNFGCDWETVIGTPSYFWPINYRYVAIYAKPGSDNYGSMTVFYRKIAPVTGDFIDIPDDHTKTLQNYVAMDLQDKRQEYIKAGTTFQAYMKSANELRQSIRNQRIPDRVPGLRG